MQIRTMAVAAALAALVGCEHAAEVHGRVSDTADDYREAKDGYISETVCDYSLERIERMTGSRELAEDIQAACEARRAAAVAGG